MTCAVIDGVSLSPEKAGQMSSLFDIGGVMGGVLIGYLSDRLGAKACTTTMFLLLSIPMLQMYRTLGDASFEVNMALLIGSGLLVNGPYALITTAISADLGTHESLQGNAQALATVTAIIDGTGSIGAVVGPLMTGFITQVRAWRVSCLRGRCYFCVFGWPARRRRARVEQETRRERLPVSSRAWGTVQATRLKYAHDRRQIASGYKLAFGVAIRTVPASSRVFQYCFVDTSFKCCMNEWVSSLRMNEFHFLREFRND